MYLPDVNVLLALALALAFAFETHEHHPRALSWLNSVSDREVSVCRMAQSGFLRFASAPGLQAVVLGA